MGGSSIFGSLLLLVLAGGAYLTYQSYAAKRRFKYFIMIGARELLVENKYEKRLDEKEIEHLKCLTTEYGFNQYVKDPYIRSFYSSTLIFFYGVEDAKKFILERYNDLVENSSELVA